MARLRRHIARGTLTRAQFNAGTIVIPDDPSRMYRVTDCYLIARGANSNCTAAVIKTGHATPVTIWTCNHANLTQNALMRPSIASGGTHAIGAGFNADLTTGGGVKIMPSGTESSATSFDYCIKYVVATP
jgi:hypothetical protein